jgi:hypothetical protein
VALLLAGCSARSAEVAPPKVAAQEIGGVVSGPKGPEAGVWVIAETKDLPTRFAKIVVTDDQGRFLIPDLPQGAYRVWARGYGIADTAAAQAEPGATVRLAAREASPAEAAKVYPAAYWFSMLKVPAESEFSGPKRNPELPPDVTSQAQYLTQMKNGGCVGCHQLGDLSTRTIPKAFHDAGSSEAQWMRRIQAGQAGPEMVAGLSGLGPIAVRNLADWTDRIAAGKLPVAKPARPQGLERNVVVTVRDWLDDKHYLHDLVSTDRRNPTVNANGLLYGSTELSTGVIPVLDPVKNTAAEIKAPVRDPDTPIAAVKTPMASSAYWGDQAIWDSQANIHNPMFDEKGRVWLTASVRAPGNSPAFCRAGSGHPSAQQVPLDRSGRQLAMFDPKTGKYSFIDTCFANHHLQFDAKGVLWTSGGGPVVGWFDAPLYDRTGDVAKAQGWTPVILDSNGNGRRDAYTEPGQPADPAKDRRIIAPFYAIMPSPADGSVWGSVWAGARQMPWSIVRINPGPDPSRTALAEVYTAPAPAYGIRGADIDSQGVVWGAMASGHLASFDRRKCKGPLNGPTATGAHCPEGWTLYRLPGPSFEAGPDQSVESSYYVWVDQHDTLGLGKDVPIVTGNQFDGVHALVNGRFITLRTPYPLGFYAKGLDGRIDNADGGWNGRGLWITSGDRTPWHHEGGLGTKPLVLHIQMRPNPLAD